MQIVSLVIASAAKQSSAEPDATAVLDCFVASLLAMTEYYSRLTIRHYSPFAVLCYRSAMHSKKARTGPKVQRTRKLRGFGHERRGEILNAAKHLFVQEGYAAVTTRQVAERAGLSQTGLYVHFRDKQEILDELREATFRSLILKLKRITSKRSADPKYLERLLKGYLRFALDNRDEYQLTMLVPHAASKKHPPKDLNRPASEQSAGLAAFLLFRDEISALAAEGVIVCPDANVVTQSLWGALHGLATLIITHPEFPWVAHAQLIDTLVGTLVRGLRVGPD
ncbi:TetR/AcrR family transcriptional regulator [Bradyrhizobium sp. LHD-71]|uniref:TetR/AcrR family transcriptional regulator n=1 Tax=Bradyrhizobium sp. LHD-71 TaxID=3072141 RepID=UPI00280DDA27|nr:TetR/AcrR family transcriptional regulator [Bradyrhizobium sp. LHD-71]MDQ8727678.1 TetR/AcrR family transcriptional regulator [Bradyrhizobium sp. LHD-71]